MKKFLTYFTVLILLLLVLIISIPFLFKNNITALIKKQANNNLHAVVNFNDNIGLTIIKSFPNLSLSVKDITIAGVDEFYGDTLINLKQIDATLDLMSVIKGDQIRILNISLLEPNLYAKILKTGKANWDIAKQTDTTDTEDTDTAASSFNIKLKKLKITNAKIVYNDLQGNINTEINNLNYTLTGDFSQDIFTMQNILSIAGITIIMDGINYLSNSSINFNADIEANMPQMAFTFKENILNINALQLAFNGSVKMPDNNIETDLTFAVKENSFKNFLSLIPAVYATDLNALQTKGNLAFNGFLKGIFNQNTMPAFGLNLNINEGWFKYHDMPMPLENVFVDLKINKPQGDIDLTRVELKRCDFIMQKNPFSLLLNITTPISNPFIDLTAKGKIDFSHIKNLMPLEKGTELSGIMQTNIFAKGFVSDIEKKQYSKFSAGGKLNLKNIFYNSSELPQPFSIPVADMDISPSVFNLKELQASVGQSDFKLNGNVQNFLPYLFNKGLLQANFNLVSNQINANEFLTDDESNAQQAVEDTSTMSVFEVPENLNITFNSSIKKLIYTNMQISDFNGIVTVINKQINFTKVSLQTLGSSITMDGFYNTVNIAEPKVSFNFGINNLDIQQAFKTFNTIQKLAPAAEKIAGIFNMNFSMQTHLTENMQPNLNSLLANGFLNIPKAEINNLTTLSKLADALGKPEFKKGSINNAKINFKVENGRITTQPFDVALGGKNISLSGSSGLDQTIDYIGKTTFKRSEFGTANTAINNSLAQLNQKLGSNINMSDMVPVEITITGTFDKPKIGTNLGQLAKSEIKNLTGQITDEAAKRKAELEAKAKAEADRLRQEAEEKAKKLKEETEAKAKAEADRLRREAEEKANAEKERLKKQAEEEVKKKLKRMF